MLLVTARILRMLAGLACGWLARRREPQITQGR